MVISTGLFRRKPHGRLCDTLPQTPMCTRDDIRAVTVPRGEASWSTTLCTSKPVSYGPRTTPRTLAWFSSLEQGRRKRRHDTWRDGDGVVYRRYRHLEPCPAGPLTIEIIPRPPSFLFSSLSSRSELYSTILALVCGSLLSESHRLRILLFSSRSLSATKSHRLPPPQRQTGARQAHKPGTHVQLPAFPALPVFSSLPEEPSARLDCFFRFLRLGLRPTGLEEAFLSRT